MHRPTEVSQYPHAPQPPTEHCLPTSLSSGPGTSGIAVPRGAHSVRGRVRRSFCGRSPNKHEFTQGEGSTEHKKESTTAPSCARIFLRAVERHRSRKQEDRRVRCRPRLRQRRRNRAAAWQRRSQRARFAVRARKRASRVTSVLLRRVRRHVQSRLRHTRLVCAQKASRCDGCLGVCTVLVPALATHVQAPIWKHSALDLDGFAHFFVV
jgi:hypothetical protein